MATEAPQNDAHTTKHGKRKHDELKHDDFKRRENER
jgi:hypothetical protein